MSKIIHIFSNVNGLLQNLATKNLPCTFKNVVNADFDGPLTEEQRNCLASAEILVADPGLILKYQLAHSLPGLKWMQSTWAGIDAFIKSLDNTKPLPKYRLTRFGGYFGEHMAEFVIGHMVAYERDFNGMREAQANSHWNNAKFKKYRLLQELNVGIIGAGDIGKIVAKSCKDFNMTVWGMVSRDVTPQNRCPHIDHYRKRSDLKELLEQCDWLVCILPSTPDTRQLLSGDALASCKKKPVLINLGRGDLINEDSLINALDEGWISQAILDVTETEPLPETSRLWQHKRVTIAPHVSATSFDWQVAEGVADNVKRYYAGESLKFEVDLNKGY